MAPTDGTTVTLTIEAAVMLFDACSCYAADDVTGRWQPNANFALTSGVGVKAAGGRRGDGPDGALGARRRPLGERW
jgi:hypothetical protein